jgi:glutamine cyclotransferase
MSPALFDPTAKRVLQAVLTFALCAAGTAQAAIPVYGYVVKKTYPHDPQAFTQGLLFKDGFLYESTGLNGRSSVRKVQLETGKVLMSKDIASEYFGEGLTEVGNELVNITWTSQQGFVYDIANFKLKKTFTYPGEGWGLASDGKQIYMSDGSAAIRVLDPKTLIELRRIQVTADGKPITQLNELEWVEGELYANIWQTDVIARIDPASGRVVGWIDLGGLLQFGGKDVKAVDVLNGIAYDSKRHRLFVTGKLWPKLFEIELIQRRQ